MPAAELSQLVAGEVGATRERLAAGGPVEQSPQTMRVEGDRDDAATRPGDAGQLAQDGGGVGELQRHDGNSGVGDTVRQWQVPRVGPHESTSDAASGHRQHPGRQVHAQHPGSTNGQVIDEPAGGFW